MTASSMNMRTAPVDVSKRTVSTVHFSGSTRTRSIQPSLLRQKVQVEFYTFPSVESLGVPATWCKVDGEVCVTCPRCGKAFGILLSQDANGYRIDARGLLYPSLFCPNGTCDFDHYVLLQGWRHMGAFGRKRDNARGVTLYCMVWAKRHPITREWNVQPFEYTHAVNAEAATDAWMPMVRKDDGMVIAIAPAIDPHVAGADDPNKSILSL